MRLGKLPSEIPRLAVNYRGGTYTVVHPVQASDDGRQTDGFGQSGSAAVNETQPSTSEEHIYFHDRRMDVEQTDVGERRVERIESTSKPDVQLAKDDRTDHDGVTWVCETVETKPTPQNPSVVKASWKNTTSSN